MRKLTRKGLIRKLDKLVTQILLLKENGRCVICGSTQKLGAGHIFSRRYYNTRWDIEDKGDVHLSCWPCNRRHVFDTYPYFTWYIKKFGQKEFDNLYQRWQRVTHLKVFQLQTLKESLETILKDLHDKISQ